MDEWQQDFGGRKLPTELNLATCCRNNEALSVAQDTMASCSSRIYKPYYQKTWRLEDLYSEQIVIDHADESNKSRHNTAYILSNDHYSPIHWFWNKQHLISMHEYTRLCGEKAERQHYTRCCGGVDSYMWKDQSGPSCFICSCGGVWPKCSFRVWKKVHTVMLIVLVVFNQRGRG